jgi:hypothetical protein
MLRIILLNNKVMIFLVLICHLTLSNMINEMHLDTLYSSHTLLYFSPSEILKQNEEHFFVNVFYLGNLYQVNISTHFGGQFILRDKEIQNKYYILVSNELELLFDSNDTIKGYKVNSKNIKNAKMYAFYLVISTNDKNDMSYNWRIEEMDIPEKILPNNTIIIYSNPEYINFKEFNKKFDRLYPSKKTEFECSTLILPQILFNPKELLNNAIENNIAIVDNAIGHIKINQSNIN